MTRPTQRIPIRRAKRLVAHALAGVILLLRLWRPRRAVGEECVVILEPFGLGDVVSYQPLIAALQMAGHRVTFCGRPEWRGLHPEVEWLDTAVPWGRHLPGEKYSIRDYWGATFRSYFQRLRTVCRGRIGIDVRGDLRDVLLLYLAGCREVVTLSHYVGSEARVARWVGRQVTFDAELRRWELTLRFADLLGVKPSQACRPAFPHLRSGSAMKVNQVGYICVAPWRGKCWGPALWRELTRRLRAQGMEPVILCGPGQADAARGEAGDDLTVWECGNLEAWATRLQECRFLVSIDSGPMHLADALDIPAVALFGQGLLPTWGPSHPASVVVSHQSDSDFKLCAPTEENTAQGMEFMGRITVEEVMAAVAQLRSRLGTTAGP